MPDINLFGEPGFQEAVSEPEPSPESEMSEVKGKQEKKPAFSSVERFTALVLAIAIGVAVVWYLVLRSNVRSEIREFTPEEFHAQSVSEASSNTNSDSDVDF